MHLARHGAVPENIPRRFSLDYILSGLVPRYANGEYAWGDREAATQRFGSRCHTMVITDVEVTLKQRTYLHYWQLGRGVQYPRGRRWQYQDLIMRARKRSAALSTSANHCRGVDAFFLTFVR